MKALKITLIVLCTILLIVSSISAAVSAAGRLIFANPFFYGTYLPMLNVYDAEYEIIVNILTESNFSAYNSDEGEYNAEQKELLGKLIEMAVSKKQFNEYTGRILSDMLNDVAYNKAAAVLPFEQIKADAYSAIENSPEFEALTPEEKTFLIEAADQRFAMLMPEGLKGSTLKDYLYFYTGYNEDKNSEIDDFLDNKVNFYAQRLNLLLVASFVGCVLMLFALFILMKDNKIRFVKIISGINVFHLVVCIIVIASLVISIFIIPVWFSSDGMYELNMLAIGAVDFVKAVLYIFAAVAVVLISLQIVLRHIINKDEDRAHDASLQGRP